MYLEPSTTRARARTAKLLGRQYRLRSLWIRPLNGNGEITKT